LTAAIVPLAALLAHAVAVNAGRDPNKHTVADLELLCLTEQPAIVEGETATLKAWASTADGRPINTPINFAWEIDAGRIEAQVAATRWDLSMVKVEPQAARKVTGTVRATQPGQRNLQCTVEVFIGKNEATIPDRGTLRGESLLSARRYLLSRRM
jgi:hypothetical protein